MKNFKRALFYISLFGCTFASGLATAQLNADINKQGNRAPQQAVAPKINPVFANKPQVILFKIHDIKPVLNSDGATTGCEYTATFYNRTPVSLRQAKIEFGWTDHVSELFPIDGTPNVEENAKENAKETTENQPKAVKKEAGLGEIRSTIDIPALGSLKQVSVHGVAETDKCFALFDNLKFNVSVCNILGQETNTDSRRAKADANKGQANCAGMFAYVNSKHPEYYGEFKEISYEEQVEREKTQEEKEKEMIQAINGKITENLEKTNTIISNIK
ncbi:MAG: hypothetical protein IJ870_02875 [Alphaproteobacteria bacterium]|nr:hypothetical protein [Alphaproteobacteria bacterium]